MGRSSPNDKLLLVQALRRKGHVVAVTGDGTNDAPALHEVCVTYFFGYMIFMSSSRTHCNDNQNQNDTITEYM